MERPARKRVRRTLETSRQVILEAAEQRLIAEGPHGVKVQTIARDLGMTDAAIHYHFGSREGLLEALLRFSGRRFLDELAVAMDGQDPASLDVGTAARLLSDLYERRGTARLAMWLMLSGWSPTGTGMLQPLALGVHKWRADQATRAGLAPPMLEDSQKLVALLSAVTFTQALSGDALMSSVGLPDLSTHDYLSWVTALVGQKA